MNKEKDKCIWCNCDTPYHKEENVDNRYYYVDGAGQLCEGCWNEVYKKSSSPRRELNLIK